MLLDLPARPKLVERALRHSREDVHLAAESLLEHIVLLRFWQTINLDGLHCLFRLAIILNFDVKSITGVG